MGRLWIAALATVLLALPAAAQESDAERARTDDVEELRSQLQLVISELARLRTEIGVPEEPELESAHGLGPAASKVYGRGAGISLGGYAEAVYRRRTADAPGDGDDFADFVRTVLYVGYKFNDRLLFNTEIEFEHASTGEEGSVSVEFASLEYLFHPAFNLRGGLLLIPMGFVNEVHEPPFYYATERPEPERRIIPSTWREDGIGLFGSYGERLSYRLYVVNGFDATGFDGSGLRGGRQDGSKARAEDLAVVARLDYDLLDGLQVGGSYYRGNAGQDQTLSVSGVDLPDVPTAIWELHADYRRGPLHLRGLWTQARVGDSGRLSRALTAENLAAGTPKTVAVSSSMIGGYGEIGYDLWQWLRPGSEKSLIPFFRIEYLDTQHDLAAGLSRSMQPRRLLIPGLHFKPHPNVVLKLDYRNIDAWGGNAIDEIGLGMGLVF
jgi:hypothetical protein